MPKLRKMRVWLVLALVVVLGASLLTPAPAVAAPNVVGCLPDVGKRVPVLFVHGFHGDNSIWQQGTPSMQEVVSKIPAIYADIDHDTFDYSRHSDKWVDDPHIGLELAKRIACMAQSSREQGGSGKVIVVAHSMGGLATRYAATQTIDNHKVADDLGLVVTLGTPNMGTGVADWGMALLRSLCTFAIASFAGRQVATPPDCGAVLSAIPAMQGNVRAKVASLPLLSPNVPVLAIAGDVSYTLFFMGVPVVLNGKSGGDLMVPLNSALAGANDPTKGGGTVIVSCHALVPIPVISDANCWHGALPQNAEVQKAVVAGIQQYLQSLSAVSAQSCSVPTSRLCVGTVTGDVDGDGKANTVQVALRRDTLELFAVFSLTKDGTKEQNLGMVDKSSGVSVVGVTDVNGDGLSELYVAVDYGAKGTWGSADYSLRMVHLPGDRIADAPNSTYGVPSLSRFGSTIKGFACQRVNGRARLELSYGYDPAKSAEWTTSRVYEADAGGVLHHLFFETRGDQQTVQQSVGFHCPGLTVTPHNWVEIPSS